MSRFNYNSARFEKKSQRNIILAGHLESSLALLIKQVPSIRVFQWAYVGSDYRRMLELEKGELQQWQRIKISEKLQAAAQRFRKPFIEWVGELGRQRNSLCWWAGSIAEKEPYVSGLFQNCCYLQVALELIGENRDSGLLLIVESPGLGRQIAGCLDREKLLFPDGSKIRKTFGRGQGISGILRFYIHYLVRTARELRSAHRTRRAGSLKDDSGREIVLATYVDEGVLLPDGRLKDILFTGLPEWLSEKNCLVSWLPIIYKWPESWSEAVTRVRACRERRR